MTGTERHTTRNALRWTASGLLIVLVAVLMPVTLVARFTHSQILDTDRYVETVAPLGADPAVQNEIADQATRQIFSHLDIEAITAQTLTTLTENAPLLPTQIEDLAPVIADQVEGFIRDTVHSLVSGDRFETLWIQANRSAHENLVAVATGKSNIVQIDEKGTVAISLEVILSTVRDRLYERGFDFADEIPHIDANFVIFQSADLVKAQKAVDALDKAATWLPWLTGLAAVGAIVAAPRGGRRRALSLVGLGVAIAMALLGPALHVARTVYLGDLPAEVLSPAAASAIVDTMSMPLLTMLRVFFGFGLVVALVGYLAGGSRSARAVRGGFTRATGRGRGGNLRPSGG